jgi:hypothetical protein
MHFLHFCLEPPFQAGHLRHCHVKTSVIGAFYRLIALSH